MTKVLHLTFNELQVIKGCKRGDQKSQRLLYQQYASKMLGVSRRYTKSVEDAEEVLSNAFIKAFKNFEHFKGEGSLEGWLRKIVVRESLNFIRYQKNLFVELEEDLHADKQHYNPDQAEVDRLMGLIDDLPLGYKTVFNLFAIEGYSHKEIAEMLEISENTSKSQLSKARSHLQKRLSIQLKLERQ
jgi:RNA polymerase sigma-70 factor (ECF subfamily)